MFIKKVEYTIDIQEAIEHSSLAILVHGTLLHRIYLIIHFRSSLQEWCILLPDVELLIDAAVKVFFIFLFNNCYT